MARHSKNAAEIIYRIEAAYNKLNYDGYGFFKAHHDNLRLQLDCAKEALGELEVYEKTPKKKYGEVTGEDMCLDITESLKDTLLFAEAVIRLQQQTMDLPIPVFG